MLICCLCWFPSGDAATDIRGPRMRLRQSWQEKKSCWLNFLGTYKVKMCAPVSISTRILAFNSWRMHEQDINLGNRTWSEKKFEIRGLKQQSLLLQACLFSLVVQHHLPPTVSFIFHPLYYIPSMWENLHIWTKTLPIHGAICSPGCKTGDTSTNILHLPSLRRRLLVWSGMYRPAS